MQPYALFSGSKCVAAGPDVETGRRLRTSGQVLVFGEAAEGYKVPAPVDLYETAAAALYASPDAVEPRPVAKVPELAAAAFLAGPGDVPQPMPRQMRREVSRVQGYTGDECGACFNFTMVRNGTCLKCESCGSTSGCS